MAYYAGDISCVGEGIEKYFRLFSKLKIAIDFEKNTVCSTCVCMPDFNIGIL